MADDSRRSMAAAAKLDCETLRTEFTKCDKEGSGTLSRPELEELLVDLVGAGIHTAEVNGAYDRDGTYQGRPQWAKRKGGRTFELFTTGSVEPWWNLQEALPDGAFAAVSYGAKATEWAGAAKPPLSAWASKKYKSSWTGANPPPLVVTLADALAALETAA